MSQNNMNMMPVFSDAENAVHETPTDNQGAAELLFNDAHIDVDASSAGEVYMMPVKVLTKVERALAGEAIKESIKIFGVISSADSEGNLVLNNATSGQEYFRGDADAIRSDDEEEHALAA